jgi:hypothetical protein
MPIVETSSLTAIPTAWLVDEGPDSTPSVAFLTVAQSALVLKTYPSLVSE